MTSVSQKGLRRSLKRMEPSLDGEVIRGNRPRLWKWSAGAVLPGGEAIQQVGIVKDRPLPRGPNHQCKFLQHFGLRIHVLPRALLI